MEPRHSEPLYNEILDILNEQFYSPINSKTYEKEGNIVIRLHRGSIVYIYILLLLVASILIHVKGK